MKKLFAVVIGVVLILSGCSNLETIGGNNLEAKLIKVDEIPDKIKNVKKEGLGANKYIQALVVKVTDGDTVEVTYKGDTYKVRLLDVDTPESVKQGVPLQSYAKEASEFSKKMLLNQPVKLVFEKDLKDKYGRLLAHLLLKEGTYFNALLVRNGFARVETISPNTALKEYFYMLQEKAVEDRAGMWSLPDNKRPFIKDNKGEYVPKYLFDKKAS